MLTIADVLEPEDVARVREGLAKAAFTPGKKTAGGDARRVKANWQAEGSDPTVEALSAFVKKALDRHPLIGAYVRPARWSRLMFNRYGVGETYGMHVDDPMMGEAESRIRTDLSFTLFLSDPDAYEGGALVVDGLEGEREIKLSAGSMVLYATGQLHRVEPVTKGERLACVGWVQSLIRRDDQRELLFDLSQVRSAMARSEARLLLDKSVAQLVRMWGEP
jgi:PKHD-type hydroxylase